jgi:hypothetical protein
MQISSSTLPHMGGYAGQVQPHVLFTVRTREPELVTAAGRLLSGAFCIPIRILHPDVFSFCSQVWEGDCLVCLISNP